MSLVAVAEADYVTIPLEEDADETASMSPEELHNYVGELEERMREAARKFEFEKAAEFRDRVKSLKQRELYDEFVPGGTGGDGETAGLPGPPAE